MSFHVGQKVVCVGWGKPTLWHRFFTWLFPYPGQAPQIDGVYTVSKVHRHNDGDCLSLFEIDCRGDSHWTEGWTSEGFRPLTELSTDTGMAILRQVAADASKKREHVASR